MLLKNAKVLSGRFIFSDLDIKVNNGKIEKLYLRDEPDEGKNDEILDLSGLTVLPGFIDIHTHGCAGCDTMDASYESINTMSKFMAQNGVTSFLPTTMTQSSEAIENTVCAVDSAIKKGVDGANALGVHMEGPYINGEYAGAQNKSYLSSPSKEQISNLQKKYNNRIKTITIAPEIEGAMEFIKYANNEGIVISLGHTGADYDICKKAIDCGAKHATHLFNAMTHLVHRMPGLPGAAFDSDMSVEMICDGIHIHPAVIRLTYKVKGPDKMVLISDSMRATGLEDGDYELGGQPIVVKDGVARTEEGLLAGSTATVLRCIKNVIKFGIKPENAVRMATINPAELIGVDKFKGSIEEGKDADLVVVDDKFDIKYVFIGGNAYSL